MTKEQAVEIINTNNREVLSTDGEFAEVKVVATKQGIEKEDTIARVPLTFDALKEKFSTERIYKLAIREYFNEQRNSLRDYGFCKENRPEDRKEAVVKSMSTDELMSMLSEEQREALRNS